MSSSAPGEDLLWLMHQLADGNWHSGEALASEAGISQDDQDEKAVRGGNLPPARRKERSFRGLLQRL